MQLKNWKKPQMKDLMVFMHSSPIIPTDESHEKLPEKEAKPARKVRKTKTVKKEEDKTSPPIKSGPDIADDDDFSDFSFD